MTATFFHRVILSLGLLSLLHAAYSAAQHRSYLRLNELEFTHLPLDMCLKSGEDEQRVIFANLLQIFIQALLSLYVVMYGVLYVAGDFREIRASADLENKSWETFSNIPSFYVFNHRGRMLSPHYDPKTDYELT